MKDLLKKIKKAPNSALFAIGILAWVGNDLLGLSIDSSTLELLAKAGIALLEIILSI